MLALFSRRTVLKEPWLLLSALLFEGKGALIDTCPEKLSCYLVLIELNGQLVLLSLCTAGSPYTAASAPGSATTSGSAASTSGSRSCDFTPGGCHTVSDSFALS